MSLFFRPDPLESLEDMVQMLIAMDAASLAMRKDGDFEPEKAEREKLIMAESLCHELMVTFREIRKLNR